ncbi:cache domain-containing protein [Ideonella sp. BN130291]|uniref:cache domain-containing protein n=1 Tax=Ideonella sp. BN130291 TaxID=3112940 RepID=UPI002E25AC5F|nr:cache domain-containing protein [Ideonella sp. BN130291]
MRLKAKLLILAAVPLLLSLALIAAAVLHQQRELALREHQLVEREYMAARRAELRHYVELAVSTVRPLYEAGADEPTRAQAMARLSSLDYGSDGYFFVYDLHGTVLMHSRQPELVGRNLWDLRDPKGRPTIQQLIAQARNGGGYVDYLWRKPSTGQLAPKLGYVVALPKWNWMVGTGLYLDDIQATVAQVDRQVASNIETTLLWIAGIAFGGVALISVSGLWLNLSEHRVADAKLRLLARQVVQSQEDERAHLARELHDGTSQTLVSAKLLVESAVDQMEREQTRTPASLAKALARLNESLTEVRRISHRLRPAMLDTLGLPAALQLLGREFGEDGGADVNVAVQGVAVELPEEVNTVLFRVAQEALANIAKHAAARAVRVVLGFGAGGVTLRIEDDGRGFDLQAVQLDPRRGIGLRNMRERLGSIGGRFEVQAAPGQGTLLSAQVPAEALERFSAGTR